MIPGINKRESPPPHFFADVALANTTHSLSGPG